MQKRNFILKFRCGSNICGEKSRLEELEFDFLGRAHCMFCKGYHFEVFKERIYDDEIKPEYKKALVETKKYEI